MIEWYLIDVCNSIILQVQGKPYLMWKDSHFSRAVMQRAVKIRQSR